MPVLRKAPNVVGNAMRHTILILITIITTSSIFACTCRRITLTEETLQSDQIFIGKVISKITTDNNYYLFSVLNVYKGKKVDTITIKTGFGSGDCGMLFEIGKMYIVYSVLTETSVCSRNTYLDTNSDIEKYEFLVRVGLSNDKNKSPDPTLTDYEASYLNADLLSQRKDFDFSKKKITVHFIDSFISKDEYIDKYASENIPSKLIILTEKEKVKTKGLDAIIVMYSTKEISYGDRKKILKRLTG